MIAWGWVAFSEVLVGAASTALLPAVMTNSSTRAPKSAFSGSIFTGWVLSAGSPDAAAKAPVATTLAARMEPASQTALRARKRDKEACMIDPLDLIDRPLLGPCSTVGG